MASSLDQPGPCARTVLDAALLHEVMGGHDPADSTSINAPLPGMAPVEVDLANRQVKVAGPADQALQALAAIGFPAKAVA